MPKYSSPHSAKVTGQRTEADHNYSEQPDTPENIGLAGSNQISPGFGGAPQVNRLTNALQRTINPSSKRTVFRSIQRAYGNQFANKVSDSYHHSREAVSGTVARQTGVIQRITHNSVDIVIKTLTVKECNEHLGRIARKDKGVSKGNDNEFTYAPTDKDELQKRILAAKEAEADGKKAALVIELEAELASLATAADFAVKPEWDGHNPGQGTMTETYASGNIKADKGSVVARWKAFLGAGPYTQKHPRDGSVAVGRLVSADGKRSIRYGDHEKTSSTTLHHFHEETWTYNIGGNTVDVANQVRRVPVT
jgi:hypothetical protein